MNAPVTAETLAAAGWRHLRAFFSEGAAYLPAAIDAFERAERSMRRAPAAGRDAGASCRPTGGRQPCNQSRLVPQWGDAGSGGSGEGWDAVLIGLSIALRLRHEPGDARRAVVLAQELLNVTRRRSGEAAAVPLRAYLEDAYRDLAETTSGGDAARAAEEGIEACDRTLALVRRFHVDGAAAHARAVKAALLRRRAAAPPAGIQVDVRALRREAGRLTAAALAAWPERDAEGRAAVEIDLALALVDDAAPRSSAIEKAERLLRRAAAAVPAGNRYLAARLARARARVALAAGRAEALDLIESAAAAFRRLGLDREAQEVEQWL